MRRAARGRRACPARQGPAGPAGPAGPRGFTGLTGATGPTEGAASDTGGAAPAPVSEFVAGPRTVTTTRAGRLFVSRYIGGLFANCSAGSPWRFWLTVAGARVRGAVSPTFADNEAQGNVTLTGVTTAARPAGDHNVEVRLECTAGTVESAGVVGGDVTVVVLGS